jgi:urocanate hydratase
MAARPNRREENQPLTPDPIPSAVLEFALQVERLYAALIGFATNEEPSLGGKLLYAGELAPDGRALLFAANIAGAASLAASADIAAQKLAIRDGVVDFLVNSLHEALRILKNEIRKHETVAVCIAAAPEAVEREMLERGVVPDLLPPIEPAPLAPGEAFLSWSVATAPAQWLPKLDAIALDCLSTTPDYESRAARRWLRLAPRYLGRLAQGIRVLRCESIIAKQIAERIQIAVNRGEFAAEVHIAITS